MSAEFPWESWFHKEHAVAGGLLTENYLLRKQVEALKASAIPDPDTGDEEDAPKSIYLAWGLYYKASAAWGCIATELRNRATDEGTTEADHNAMRRVAEIVETWEVHKAADLLEQLARK